MEPFSDPFLEPGVLVRHPTQDDWGVGQVQSVAGRKVTVNFENAGKQTIDAAVVRLVFVGDDPRDTGRRGI
jgi:transcription elongation factor GreA-like protein